MTRLRSRVLDWRTGIATSDLPRTTRAVAWALANYMSPAGESAFPGVRRLCRDVGNQKGDGPASPNTVIEALQQLQDGGWLERVRQGGGRSHRSEWQARLPESVHQVNPSDAETTVPIGVVREAVTRSLSAAETAPDEPPAERKTVHQVNPSRQAESVHLDAERVQSQPVKGAAGETEVVQEGTMKGSSSRVAAAAGELLENFLKELGVGVVLRRRALEDPLRAKAWLDLAQSEATTNVAGYFRTGFDSGEWPSARFGREKPGDARKRWCFEYGVRLELHDAYAVIDDWRDIDDVEREQMREWVDEARVRKTAEEQAA